MAKYFINRVLLMLAATVFAIQTRASDVVVTVGNVLNWQRQEVVAVDVNEVSKLLMVGDVGELVVYNAVNQEVASQLTHDGKLLFEAAVGPNASAKFTIKVGKKHEYTSYVGGAVYPKRLDDLTFENDRAIYRMYGPALQRTGERSFGTDVWTKSTPLLDANNRYEAEIGVRDTVKMLREQGKNDEAQRIMNDVSYHLDHGTGLDAYAVGPTLGCGAPALMVDDRLVMPYCWRECDILDNGPLRFSAHLIYNKSTVGDMENVVEHRLVSIDKGSNFCQMTVWYEGLKHKCDLATGVVVHSADTVNLALEADCALYADPTDRPELLNQQLFVGTLYPEGGVRTKFLRDSSIAKGVAGHAVGITTYEPNTRFSYFFGAAWSAADVRTWDEWRLVARQFIAAQRSPLIVTMQK